MEAKQSSADPVLVKLQAHVFKYRIAVEQCFEDFDKLNSGKITQEQFKRGLARFNLPLDAQEIQRLLERFHTGDPEAAKPNASLVPCFDRRAFTEALNSVFSYSLKHKEPTVSVLNPREVLSSHKQLVIESHRASKLQSIGSEERQSLEQVVARIRTEVDRRRVFVKPHLKEHDRLNRGVITVTQFHRVLSTLGLVVSEAEMKLLVWKYTTDLHPDDICYTEFLSDIQEASSPRSPAAVDALVPKSLSETSPAPPAAKSVEQLLRHLQGEAHKKHLYLRDMFVDFDQLRSGRVHQQRWRGILNTLGQIELTEAEHQALFERYKDVRDKDAVNYAAFCDDLEQVFTQKNLDKAPTLKPATLQELRLTEEDTAELPADTQAINAVIGRLSTQVKAQSISHKPFFQAHDRTHNGLVTFSQFCSTLQNLGFKLTEAELGLLRKRYGKVNDDRIKYIAFCSDIEA